MSPCNFRARARFYFLSSFLFSADAFYFLLGFLFSDDVFEFYEGLPQPVWIAQGARRGFTDYRLERRLLNKDNWSDEVFQTGTLPFFEMTLDFIAAYEQLLQEH